VFASGDTMFNESFATEVERQGGARWLAERATPQAREQYQQFDGRRQEFRALMDRYRLRFQTLYATAETDEAKRARKADLMTQWRSDYQALKLERWNGYTGYDAAMQRANNAALGVQAAYTQWVPAFDALLTRENGDFARFYAEAKRLAGLPKPQRDATLRSLMPAADATARSSANPAAGS
jgi:predicted aminopeptidase